MDFLFDYISSNTYWTILLIIHGRRARAPRDLSPGIN
jgi:hypothetical protein